MSTKGTQGAGAGGQVTLLTPDQVGVHLGVSSRQVKEMKAEIGFVRVGRFVRFHPEQVERYIKDRTVRARTEVTWGSLASARAPR